MRLPFLRPKEDPALGRGRGPASTTGDPTLDATKARTRARQRLVGAVVLLAVGVIGFPILFETQPRPLPVDTPIEIVRHNGGNAPAAAGKVRSASLPPPEAGIELAPTASAPVAAAMPVARASVPAAAASRVPGPASAAHVAARPEPAQPPAEAVARSRPSPAASAAAPAAAAPSAAASVAQAARYVVQAGAYLDAASLREARQTVERLGLKTYTQVVETPTGKRTRVRVGPFEKRSEADAAAERIKATGLSVVVLTL